MGVNRSARKSARKVLGDDVDIDAVLLITPSIGAAKTVGFGTGKPGADVYSTGYAEALGIEADNDDVRHDLHPGWLTLTADELIVHYPGMRGLRPGPVEVIERFSRGGISLRWFDRRTARLTTRILHLEFGDGTQLLTATAYRDPAKRKPFDDEADLLIEALGDLAVEIDPD